MVVVIVVANFSRVVVVNKMHAVRNTTIERPVKNRLDDKRTTAGDYKRPIGRTFVVINGRSFAVANGRSFVVANSRSFRAFLSLTHTHAFYILSSLSHIHRFTHI